MRNLSHRQDNTHSEEDIKRTSKVEDEEDRTSFAKRKQISCSAWGLLEDDEMENEQRKQTGFGKKQQNRPTVVPKGNYNGNDDDR
ncbi:hypothetical protein N7466_000893 [Penicillium verhagenii]|uniref:uncharacterized protein n=1 Tax=Penicillium verhagenii TaxID=1562060 RepID=UPI0025450F27|nr:uncharacterized protein N7466_000893 [Penicillium verhagenii]KAJ5947878.1 hypothetical protein N7466_000893 [Penicillium verhagenii]